MIRVEKFKVKSITEEIRLSDYLLGKSTVYESRKGIKKAIERGLVKVNERDVTSGRFLKTGDKIEVYKTSLRKDRIRVDLDVSVLFEDEYLAIVNKPAGVAVSDNKARTLVKALPDILKPSSEIDSLAYPHPAHRLDYPTSGLLLVAKTQKMAQTLSDLFAKRKVSKEYLAICTGQFPETITINETLKEKEAITEGKLLKHISSDKYGGLSLVQLQPITGRRHQLRVHCANQGFPILGDKQYGESEASQKAKGLYLHAYKMTLTHPKTKEALSLVQMPPKKFYNFFDESDWPT